MSKTIVLKPRLNEKTYALSAQHVYVFDIAKNVNKHDVARAVEAQFDVNVVKVNTVNTDGKAKRIISLDGKRMKNAEGKRNDIKKAYVTLKAGQSLPFFEAVEEAEEKSAKVQAQVDKAAAKQADKEDKKPRRGLRRAKKEDDK